jgi:hypothetical protein
MKHLNPAAWFAALCLMILAGCAQLSLEKPQSIEDRIQYGKAGVSAAYRTVGDLVAARTLTAAQGASAFAKVEAVEKQVGLAETLLKGGKPQDALSTVNLALAGLTAIRAELAARNQNGA